MRLFIAPITGIALIFGGVVGQNCSPHICNTPCTVNFSGHGTMTEDQASLKWDYRGGKAYVYRIRP